MLSNVPEVPSFHYLCYYLYSRLPYIGRALVRYTSGALALRFHYRPMVEFDAKYLALLLPETHL